MGRTSRLGSDIGGTFTDLVLASDDGTTFEIGKVLTTPDAPDDAVVEGAGQVMAAAGVTGEAVAHVIHGTTLFTNALIERKGARTALIASDGFRDTLDIADESRFDQYDVLVTSTLAQPPLRDAAQHHLVDLSEQHIYIHAQAGLTLFRDVVRAVFDQDLKVHLPSRVLPLSTTPPTDLATLFEQEAGEPPAAGRAGFEQRAAATAVERIDVGAGIQQLRGDFGVAAARGNTITALCF